MDIGFDAPEFNLNSPLTIKIINYKNRGITMPMAWHLLKFLIDKT